MSYQVIARKFRPKSFADLVGQPHISQTLANALKNGRLHHALLFTGPRGTGKTSSARILAKSIRCPNSVNFVPCNECSECEEITQGRALNVTEIDGASNNGVDSIRDLRDGLGFMPSTGKFKVYIIDEVHMLSLSAFNALLKTLEEPPAHVIFIMATTEVQKIPQTILSRCQRFDFRRISTKEITARLKFICESENVQADSEALWLIARQGDGSMRDSQSLLDQVITFANEKLTLTKVTEVLGLTDRSLLLAALEALVSCDHEKTLSILEKLSEAGIEPHLFSQELLEIVRHLLLLKIAPQNQIVDLPESEKKYLSALSENVSEEDIHILFDMILKGASEIPKAQDPRLVLEMMLLRVTHGPRVGDLKALLQGKNFSSSTTSDARSEQKKKLAEPPKPQYISTDLSPMERWIEFCEKVRLSDPILGSKIEHILFCKSENNKVELGVAPQQKFLGDFAKDKESLQKLQGALDRYWGSGYSIDIKSDVDSSKVSSSVMMKHHQSTVQKEEAYKIIHGDPTILAIQDVFKGQITQIKDKV